MSSATRRAAPATAGTPARPRALRAGVLLLSVLLATSWARAGVLRASVRLPDSDATTEVLGGPNLAGPQLVDEAGLPVVVKLFAVPSGMRVVSLRVRPRDESPSRLPARTARGRATGIPESALPDGYGRLATAGRLAGVTLQPVVLRPYRTDAASGVLLHASAFDLELDLVSEGRPPSDLVRLRSTAAGERIFRESLASLVANEESAPAAPLPESPGFAPEALPSVEGSAVEMVIVTAAGLEDSLQVLADWKTKKGVPTLVRSIPWIEANYPAGQDTPERIRAFLRDAYEKWGTYLVLLAGDADQVPPRTAYSRFNLPQLGGREIPTDQYYACLDGNWNADGDDLFGEALYNGDPGDQPDLYPDLLVGRAPVETPAEAGAFVRKSIAYDTSPPAGYVETFGALGEVLLPSYWECPDSVSAILTDGKTTGEAIDAEIPAGWTRSKRYQSDCDLDRNVALAELASGHHVLAIVGHGDAFRFSVGNGVTPFVLNSDISALANGPRNPFVLTVSCNTNQLDVECIGEAFVLNPNGGAIAVLSATRGDFPSPSEALRLEMLRMAFGRGIPGFGAMTQLGRVPLVPLAGTDHLSHHWTQLTTMLFGDPELRLWTGEPGDLSVSHPDSLFPGDGAVAVSVADSGGAPVTGALVCVSDAGGAYARGRTDASGLASPAPILGAPGTVDIVVTAPGFRPYQAVVPVVPAPGPALTLTGVAIDDDSLGSSSGNGDGIVDAGETVEVVLDVSNTGAAAADSVALLATVVPGATATFDLLWNGTRDASRVLVGRDGVHPAAVPFTLDFAAPVPDYLGRPLVTLAPDPGGSRGIFVWSDRAGWHVQWSAGADSLSVTGTVVTDGAVSCLDLLGLENGDAATIAATGDTLFLDGETGPMDVEDVVGFQLADSTTVSVVSAAAVIGTVAAGATASGVVVIDVSAGARSGQTASLALELTAAGDRADVAVPLTIAAPDLEAYLLRVEDSGPAPVVGDGDGIPEAGETVRVTPTVINRGTGAAIAVTGTAAAAAAVTWIDATDDYGDIPSLAESAGTDGYLFSVQDTSAVAVDLLLVDGTGRSWSKTISFDYPAAPGSTAFSSNETSITVTWASGGEPDLAGYNVYRSDTGGGVGFAKRNFELVRSGTRFVDTGLPLGSTFHYRVTAVDSSGAESAPSAEIKAWTVQGQLGGWPQTANGNVWSSPLLTDADDGGTGELYVGSVDWNLHAWEADGTAVPGFPVPSGGEVWSSPAAADLDGDGSAEILWGSRGGGFYVVHHDGTPALGDSVRFTALPPGQEIRSTPSVADVDGDGDPEFFFGSDSGTLYGFRHDGTGLTDSTGVMLSVTMPSGVPRIWGPIALGDLDGNGTREIVFTCWNDSLYAVRHDGTRVPGFPRAGLSEFRGGAVIGDIDADGTPEILAGNRDGNIYAFGPDGSDHLPGGVLASLPDEIRGGVALANLDAGPELEIVVGCFDGRLYAFHHDGTGLTAPDGVLAVVDTTDHIVAGPIVVDVDGDGDFEIFVGHHNGNFYGFHHDGTPLDGFPVPTGLEIFATAAAGDLDGDGDVEVAFASYDQTVNVLDFDGPSSPAAYQWPMLGGNAARTANRGDVAAPTGVSIVAPPSVYRLQPAVPNPFGAGTLLRFALPRPGAVRLDVFDVSGRLVRRLALGPMEAGVHGVRWDGRDGRGREVAAGVYVVRLRGGDEVRSQKVVRLR